MQSPVSIRSVTGYYVTRRAANGGGLLARKRLTHLLGGDALKPDSHDSEGEGTTRPDTLSCRWDVIYLELSPGFYAHRGTRACSALPGRRKKSRKGDGSYEAEKRARGDHCGARSLVFE